MVNAAEIIRLLAKKENAKHKDIAERIGVTDSNFSEKLKHNSVKGQELVDIVESLGYKLLFVKNDKVDVAEPLRRGRGRQCKVFIDGETYDTSKSDAVCCAYYPKMMTELYRDPQGRFFLVIYPDWENAKNRIIPMPESDAFDFYRMYGDGSCEYMFTSDGKNLKILSKKP